MKLRKPTSLPSTAMQCTFAAVVTWILLFTEPVKADFVKGFNGSLESIYNNWLQEQKSLPGVTSLSDMPGLVWKGDSLLVEVVATAEGAETLLASTFEAYGFEVTGCGRFMCSGYLPMKNVPAFFAAECVKAVYPSMCITNQKGFKVSEQALQPRQVDWVRADDSTLTGEEGLRIGILSDSFDTLKGCAADIESNDLPNDVVVLKEYSGTGSAGTSHPLPHSRIETVLSKGY
jgi:hypothetical protein